MLKMAKVLIMLLRLTWLVGIVLGVLVSTGRGLPLLSSHIGLGFTVAALLLLLSIFGMARQYYPLGIVGVICAILLPVIGLKQFPLKFGSALGAVQIAHIVIALASIGVAEALNARLKRSAAA